jgi:hypothetical protein
MRLAAGNKGNHFICSINSTLNIIFVFQDCIVAFNFASEDEARCLKTVLNEKLESKKQRRLGELHYVLCL